MVEIKTIIPGEIITFICILMLIVGGFAGGLIGHSIGNSQMRQEAIANGAGHMVELPYRDSTNVVHIDREFSWGQ